MPLKVKKSKIYLFDIRNYTWVNTFEIEQKPTTVKPTSIQSNSSQPTDANLPDLYKPKPNSTDSNSPSSTEKQLMTMKIVVTAISRIVGTASFIGCGILLYRWHNLRVSGNQ